jgi:hypothetical protein
MINATIRPPSTLTCGCCATPRIICPTKLRAVESPRHAGEKRRAYRRVAAGNPRWPDHLGAGVPRGNILQCLGRGDRGCRAGEQGHLLQRNHRAIVRRPGPGKFTALMASAVSYHPKEDVAALALKQLAAAQAKHFDEMLADNRAGGANTGRSRSCTCTAPMARPTKVEANYTYFLYIMGSCSRGDVYAAFCRDALGLERRFARVGFGVLVAQPGTYYNCWSRPTGLNCWTPVFLTYRPEPGLVCPGRPPAMGQPGDLDPRDLLV